MVQTDVESVLKVSGGLCTPLGLVEVSAGTFAVRSALLIIAADKSTFDWVKYSTVTFIYPLMLIM